MTWGWFCGPGCDVSRAMCFCSAGCRLLASSFHLLGNLNPQETLNDPPCFTHFHLFLCLAIVYCLPWVCAIDVTDWLGFSLLIIDYLKHPRTLNDPQSILCILDLSLIYKLFVLLVSDVYSGRCRIYPFLHIITYPQPSLTPIVTTKPCQHLFSNIPWPEIGCWQLLAGKWRHRAAMCVCLGVVVREPWPSIPFSSRPPLTPFWLLCFTRYFHLLVHGESRRLYLPARQIWVNYEPRESREKGKQ